MPRKIRSMKKKRVRTNKRSVKRGGAGLRRTRTNKRSVKRGGNICTEEENFEKYTRDNAEYDLKNCNNPDQKSSYLFRVNNKNFVILSVYINQFESAFFAHFILYEEQGIYENYPKLEVNKDEPVKLETLLDACFEKIEESNNWTNVREYITDLELLHIDPYKKYLSIPYSKA